MKIHDLQDHYTITEARATVTASSNVSTLILKDASGSRFLTWSTNGVDFTKPVKLTENTEKGKVLQWKTA